MISPLNVSFFPTLTTYRRCLSLSKAACRKQLVGGCVVYIVKNFVEHCATSVSNLVEGNRKGREDLRKCRKEFFKY